MVWFCFFLCRIGQIVHARLRLLQVDIAQSSVEEDFARVELVLQAQLLVVDGRVASKIEQRIVEVGERFFKVADKEIGHSLLEVRYGEVLVEGDGSLVAVHLVSLVSMPVRLCACKRCTDCLDMFPQRSVDDAAVEEDLGSVRDASKDGDGILELVIVVVGQGLNPGLNLLLSLAWIQDRYGRDAGGYLLQRHDALDCTLDDRQSD